MSRGMLAFGMAFGLVAVTAPAAGVAQDQAPSPAPAVTRSFGVVQVSRARLGVFLEPGCDIDPDVRGDCAESPRVRAVVDGSPADLAGIQAGDTLLALDGVPLASEPGRRALARLRAGIPVVCEIGRESGRINLRVIPTIGSGNFIAVGQAPRAEFNVFRFRDEFGEIQEFQFGPEPDGPPTSGGFVVFSPDADGILQVRVGNPAMAAFTLSVDGESVALTELEGHLTRLSERLLEGATELRVGVVVSPGSADVRRHLILEDSNLARRLERVRIEALTNAREQLELLVERRNELESRGELPPAYAYAYSFRPGTREAAVAVPSRIHVEAVDMVGMSHRLGGAEFRVLTPELAEYFDVESGLLVLRVISGTPVAVLGLRGGDVVVEIGGRRNVNMPMFRGLASSAGETGLEVKWIRKGSLHTGNLAGN